MDLFRLYVKQIISRGQIKIPNSLKSINIAKKKNEKFTFASIIHSERNETISGIPSLSTDIERMLVYI